MCVISGKEGDLTLRLQGDRILTSEMKKRFLTALLTAPAVLSVLVCTAGCESARELCCLLLPLEQTVSRDELAKRYYTRTVHAVWYCGSDEQYDHFVLFGQRYAVLRSEESLPGHLRFRVDENRVKIPLRPQPISREFYPIPAGE